VKPTNERGDWFITATGRKQHILAPVLADIVIEDIAAALAKMCRFGGHCRVDCFYSVAQHSVLVSQLVPDELAFVGLMHDAAEAYLGDVIRPLKVELPDYKAIEALWEHAIAVRFRLPFVMPPEVKLADMVALATERRDLVIEHDWRWVIDRERVKPAVARIAPLEHREARQLFLERFEDLTHLGERPP